MECFVVYAAENASMIVLRDLLVNGEIKETMETFGLGVGNRDMLRGEGGGGASMSSFVRPVCDQIESSKRTGQVTVLHPHLAGVCVAPFHSCISQPCMKFDGSTIQTSP